MAHLAPHPLTASSTPAASPSKLATCSLALRGRSGRLKVDCSCPAQPPIPDARAVDIHSIDHATREFFEGHGVAQVLLLLLLLPAHTPRAHSPAGANVRCFDERPFPSLPPINSRVCSRSFLTANYPFNSSCSDCTQINHRKRSTIRSCRSGWGRRRATTPGHAGVFHLHASFIVFYASLRSIVTYVVFTKPASDIFQAEADATAAPKRCEAPARP